MLQVGDLGVYSFAAKFQCNVAPPKVELLIWFVILGKLNMKDRILRLNIVSSLDVKYVLCNEHEESIEYLFFTCKYAWELWSSFLSKWEVD